MRYKTPVHEITPGFMRGHLTVVGPAKEERDNYGTNQEFVDGKTMTGTPLHRVWNHMRDCCNTNKLEELYAQYGFCLNTLHSYEFPGSNGMAKIAEIMADFHKGLESIAGMKVLNTEDYSVGLNGLPKSDVLKYFYKGAEVEGSVVIRPSGTEPKLKAYISVTAENRETAEVVEKAIATDLEKKL